ncbi:hypothetical protein QQS21_010435, partial [Conoideocrella luteorostrata]
VHAVPITKHLRATELTSPPLYDIEPGLGKRQVDVESKEPPFNPPPVESPDNGWGGGDSLPGGSQPQAGNPSSGNQNPQGDVIHDDRGNAFPVHTTSDGHRYTGSEVPDDHFQGGGSWSTSQRDPPNTPSGISRSEQWDNSIKDGIKSVFGPFFKPSTSRDRLNSALINGGSFTDGFNAHMGQNAGSTKNPGNGGLKVPGGFGRPRG